jgi:bacterioferritin-associated ferredoxin
MYVCVCNAIKDSQVRQALQEGKSSISALRQHLACESRCGKCTGTMQNMLKEYLQSNYDSRAD